MKLTSGRGKSPKEDLIYNRILELIMDKLLRPGERLNEAKLAEVHEVPRSRIRRVFERLRDEELVTIELNKGAFLSRPTVDEARYVFETRRHLEAVAVQLACTNATPADLIIFDEQVAMEREAFAASRRDANRVAGKFHDVIAQATHNPILEKLLNGLIKRCILIQSVYEVETNVLCLTGEHERIVEAIRARQPEQATELMNHHFEHILASLDLSGEREDADLYAQI